MLQKESEFIKMKQYDMTITHYGLEFSKLSNIFTKSCIDEQSRARRVDDGLQPKFKPVMAFKLADNLFCSI